MPSYVSRIVDRELDELLPALAAVAIEGPKAVGKTATAARRAQTIHRLDVPGTRAIAISDPTVLLRDPPPVLLDEWQEVPAVWDAVRRAVRLRAVSLDSIQALLTGIAPPVHGTTSVRLTDYVHAIVASGFPGIRGLTGRALRTQLDGYLNRIVDREFTEQGHAVRRPAMLRSWMAAYAAATATTTTQEKIRNAASTGENGVPAKSTVASCWNRSSHNPSWSMRRRPRLASFTFARTTVSTRSTSSYYLQGNPRNSL